MRRRTFALGLLAAPALALGLGTVAAAARAATAIEGVHFESQATVAGRELVLNGVGLRAAAWFKLYVAGLYLPSRTAVAEQAVAQAGPKRVRIVMLREAPTVELAKAVNKTVLRNAAAPEREALRARLDALLGQINSVAEVKSGATIDFDFDPARGTLLLLDGKPRGPAIAGADFYAALLRSFIGERPYHRDLRAGMLGRPVTPKS